MKHLPPDVERWFQFARDDLRIAELALAEGIYTQTCFHAQQAVEKVLKGLLIYQERMHAKTHNLLYLWEQLSPNPLTDLKHEINLLNLFYAPMRYPDALPGSLPDGYPGRELARQALSWAQSVYQRAYQWTEEESNR